VKIDAEKLSALCSKLLGHPLDAPLTFALKPFSPEFEDLCDARSPMSGRHPSRDWRSAPRPIALSANIF